MNKPDKSRADNPPLDTVAEFQRRRKLATRYGAPPLIVTVLCVISTIVLFNIEFSSPILRVNLVIALILIGIVSWALHLHFEGKYIRCPNCDRMPSLGTRGIDVDPVVCPNCGARLREYDSFL